ncbi:MULTISPECIES: recombinase family protein [Aureimonas]|uniref:DNA invertase Pin-like site-specific DNA recombinase n=1 Tax=Aureimonas pseudogalii TaxID=1744844 RepID=A0A7W6H6Z2_9HYPH|nr:MULTISPECIES: recombinase family protein [Aureimonas]MBB3999691.1 DNA invertase Pin-like site-specific DNA recombinase [Aureimonas pseudogalii]
MPKAFSYIRFSTPDQARGDSLRRQLTAARAWCEARGLELDDSLRDLGISAYKGANRDVGALRSFLALVEAGKVPRDSFLIVESLDRLSREAVLDAAARLFDLIRAGVIVVTLSDGQVYSEERLRTDWTPLIVSIAVMARAHEESRIKGERVGAAWAAKKAAAREEGRPLTSRCPEWIAIEGGRFVVREDRAEIVRTIFQWAIEGYGRRQIVAKLNGAGTPTWRGGVGWQISTVGKILTGRLVLGEYQPHVGSSRAGTRQPSGDPIIGYYPPIVDEDTYWRAQQASQGRRVAAGRRGRGVAHLLLGLGRCTRCGGAMHLVNKGAMPKGGSYFVCSVAARKAGCENDGRWRVDHIESRLLRGLAYLDAGAILNGAQPTTEADRVSLLAARLAEIEVGRGRLLALVEDGEEGAVDRYRALGGEAKTIRRELAEATKAAAAVAADPGLKARLGEAVDLSRAMNEADGDDRHAIRTRLAEQLRQIVAEVSFDPAIGVLAILTPRPGLPADQVPSIVGASKMAAWRLWLNDDSDPAGLAGVEDMPRPDEDAKALRILAKLRGRRASA